MGMYRLRPQDHEILAEAADLLSENGENPEYDRAIIELTTRLMGLSHDEHGAKVTAALRGLQAIQSIEREKA